LEKWIPKEKQVGSVREIVLNSKNISSDSITIEGLDTRRGIHLTGGTAEYYYETLAIFTADGQERIEKIRRSLEAGELPLFVTHVHALKSAAANIGAEELSKAAYTLEEAGQRADIPYIEANREEFLAMLARQIEAIKTALAAYETGSNGAEEFNSRVFTSELVMLKEALKNMDAEIINKTIDSLLNYTSPDSVKSVIRNISSISCSQAVSRSSKSDRRNW
jgi:HPt (histidine-containing phosphotransfer) domain-containing protein